jgi:hypothetical protein
VDLDGRKQHGAWLQRRPAGRLRHAWNSGGGKLWLFGGVGYDANDTFGSLGDLWQLDPLTDEWAWLGGSSTPGNVGQAGVYGKKGVLAAANFPGGRYYVANWTDSSGAFWMFGGLGEDANNLGGFENDLWRFQPAAELTSPAANSVLAGSTVTFDWTTASGASAYIFRLGTTPGANNLFGTGQITATSTTATGLPINGETIFAAATQAAQTITFTDPPAQTYGAAPFTLTATASSGLPVSFASSTSLVCTVSGSTVTLVSAAAYCTIEASQAGNSDYGIALTKTESFWVYRETQTITFAMIPSQTVGTPLALSATASSGLAVTFTSTTTSVCTVSGTTATFIASGSCTIDANQAGNTDYGAAPTIARIFEVTAN